MAFAPHGLGLQGLGGASVDVTEVKDEQTTTKKEENKKKKNKLVEVLSLIYPVGLYFVV